MGLCLQLEQKQIPPPYRPRLESERDLANFPPEFTDEPVQLTPDDQYGFFIFYIIFLFANLILFVGKGGLISESFSLWLESERDLANFPQEFIFSYYFF